MCLCFFPWKTDFKWRKKATTVSPTRANGRLKVPVKTSSQPFPVLICLVCYELRCLSQAGKTLHSARRSTSRRRKAERCRWNKEECGGSGKEAGPGRAAVCVWTVWMLDCAGSGNTLTTHFRPIVKDGAGKTSLLQSRSLETFLPPFYWFADKKMSWASSGN